MTNTARPILSLTFFEDTAHGWLAVPVAHLRALGIEQQISEFSYRNGDIAYLEEDDDSPLFREAATVAGYDLVEDRTTIDGLCFVRDFPRFRFPA